MTAPVGRGDQAEVVEVHIVDVPVALLESCLLHDDEVVRELSILDLEHDLGDVVAQVVDARQALQDAYGAHGDSASQLTPSSAPNDQVVTATYRLPTSAAAQAERLIGLAEELDRWCERGRLVALAPSPEIVAFRRWYLGEIVRQLRDLGAPEVRSDDIALGDAHG